MAQQKQVQQTKAVVVDAPKGGDGWLSGFISQLKFFDGWSNMITGLNRRGRDARKGAKVEWVRPIESEIENLYAGDRMAEKYIDMPVDEAMKDGYEWTGISTEQAKKLTAKCKQLCFDETIKSAAKKARLYGGSVILKGYDDDVILDMPQEPGKFPILSLVVLQRFELYSTWEDVNKNILSPQFGQPELYTFVGRSAAAAYVSNIKIHCSRLIRFEGAWLPDRLRQSNNYWNDSLLTKSQDALRNYAEAHESVNAALKDLSVAVMKIKGLADLISGNCETDVIKRLELVNMTKSIIRGVVIDTDGEDFEYKTRQLTGAHELVDKAKERLSAETGIPRSVFFCEETKGGGLAANGEHVLENWYSWLESYQQTTLKPPMLALAKEFCEELGIPHENLDIEFKPVWQMSEKEIVEMRDKQSQTDQRYIQEGVVDPAEVRQSRFGGDKYSIETKIDLNVDPKPLTEDPAEDEPEEDEE